LLPFLLAKYHQKAKLKIPNELFLKFGDFQLPKAKIFFSSIWLLMYSHQNRRLVKDFFISYLVITRFG
jgi:hypothetical protein